MSFYNTLYEANNVNFTLITNPSDYRWKENPFVSYPIIDSNIAGVNRKDIMQVPRESTKTQDKPYEFVYQSCCSINVPSSEEYKNLRQVILPP